MERILTLNARTDFTAFPYAKDGASVSTWKVTPGVLMLGEKVDRTTRLIVSRRQYRTETSGREPFRLDVLRNVARVD